MGRLTSPVHATGAHRLALSRERRLAWTSVVLLILFRSTLFVFSSDLAFDADEGVFGLMAKHLAEGRAFPLFMYGQSYILAVESWVAAPLFLVFGVSAAALKLPLLIVNLAAALLLVHLLERDGGLRPLEALVASLFFVLPPPGAAKALLSASGGNVEPFLYVLVLWATRHRPVLFGLVAGLGFLQREFTIYGVAAVVLVETVNWRVGSKGEWRSLLCGLRVAAEAWLVVQFLRPFSSAAGPGTTIASIGYMPVNNLAELVQRSCVEPGTLGRGLVSLATHYGQLFGTTVVDVSAFGIDTGSSQGWTGLGWLLAAVAATMTVRVAAHVERTTAWWRRCSFFAYLVLIGGASATLYVVARCGTLSPLRYDLLSLLGAAGLTAWFLAVERRRWLRTTVVLAIVVVAAVQAIPHGRIWGERTRGRPAGAKTLLLRHLEARRIHYALADYWMAYALTFLSNERVIVASSDPVRIQSYNQAVEAHRTEAIRISRTPCGLASEVVPGVYVCPY